MARVNLAAGILDDPDDEPTPTPPPPPAPPAPPAPAPTPEPVLEVPATAAVDDDQGDDDPEPEPAPVPAGDPVKFTMKLDPADDDRAARVVEAILAELRAAGVRPRKQIRAELIRVLFAMLDTDARLRGRVAKRLLRELGR